MFSGQRLALLIIAALFIAHLLPLQVPSTAVRDETLTITHSITSLCCIWKELLLSADMNFQHERSPQLHDTGNLDTQNIQAMKKKRFLGKLNNFSAALTHTVKVSVLQSQHDQWGFCRFHSALKRQSNRMFDVNVVSSEPLVLAAPSSLRGKYPRERLKPADSG